MVEVQEDESDKLFQEGVLLLDEGHRQAAFQKFHQAAVAKTELHPNGHREAQEEAATCLLPKDRSAALGFLRMAAAHDGASRSWVRLALELECSGDQTEAKEAVQWLTKAADRGDSDAYYHLGRMAYEGRCMPRSIPAAIDWLRVAAEPAPSDQFMDACLRANLLLVVIYTQENKTDLAFHCLLEAASRRCADAQLQLACRYSTGIRCPFGADPIKSASWLKQALNGSPLDHDDAAVTLAKSLSTSASDPTRLLQQIHARCDFRDFNVREEKEGRVVRCVQDTGDEEKPVCLIEVHDMATIAKLLSGSGDRLSLGLAFNVEFFTSSGIRKHISVAEIVPLDKLPPSS